MKYSNPNLLLNSPKKVESCSQNFEDIGILQPSLSRSQMVSWDRFLKLPGDLFSPMSMAKIAEINLPKILHSSFLHRMNFWMLARVARGDDSFSAIFERRIE